MSDSEKVAQFVQVTGGSANDANFYLEANNNNLEAAISAYFEGGGSAGSSGAAHQPQQDTHVPGGGRRLGTTGGSSSYVPPPAAAATSSSSSATKKSAPAAKSKFATLNDFKGGDDEDDEEENEDNRYYAGGGRSSGQQLIGGNPKGGDEDPNDIAARLLKAARERGAKDIGEHSEEERRRKFESSGRRLGTTGEPTAPQQPQMPTTGFPPGSSRGGQPVGAPQQREEKVLTITFYADGFTVDDGELRSKEDPNNTAFLESIEKGFIPRELHEKYGNYDVSVHLIKKDEKYTPPPKVFKAFEGSGRSLGATAASSSAQAKPAATTTTATRSAAAPPASKHACDLSRPHTSIQIRLHDGTRLVAKFNNDNKVQAISDFVRAALTGADASRSIQLFTGFPKKELSDMSQTIEQAGLQNAVLTVALK